MITDEFIDKLINEGKIISKPPKKDFIIENMNMRNDFELTSLDGTKIFSTFIRVHSEFKENFSIGLTYHPTDHPSFIVTRCQGPHGDVVENPLKPIPHFGYHIHKITSAELEQGVTDPKFSRLSTEYASYEQALSYFCRYINILDAEKYFPNIHQLGLFPQ